MTKPNEQTNARWAPIVGRWSVDGATVSYLGGDPRIAFPYGICLAGDDLIDGDVSVEVQASDLGEERILLGFRSVQEAYQMVGLGGWGHAYTIGEYEPAIGWRSLASAGITENLCRDVTYRIEVKTIGQRVSLTVDGVKVISHVLKRPPAGGQVGLFAWGEQRVTFNKMLVRRRPGTVFVVMQFEEVYERLYREVVQPVSDDCGLRAYHVGEVPGPGLILRDIARGIIDAKVVVAEITPVNQNVFYELGYAHALDKPTVLLAEKGKELPFDIRGYRVLFYDTTEAGKAQLADGLKKHFHAILRD